MDNRSSWWVRGRSPRNPGEGSKERVGHYDTTNQINHPKLTRFVDIVQSIGHFGIQTVLQ